MAKRRNPTRADRLPTLEAIVAILDSVTNIVGMMRFELGTINRRLDALERAQKQRFATPPRRLRR